MVDPGKSVTFASRLLDKLPQLRGQALDSGEFQAWLKTHKTAVVDGTQFYIVGGDMLRDIDEMIVNWSRRQGLIDQKIIQDLQAQEPSDRTP